MTFEYDPAKSRSNAQKHGIDFEQAKALWDDPDAVETDLPFPDELRHSWTAKLSGADEALWTVIFTRRGGKIRLISVRRAQKKEQQKYGQGQDR